MIVYQLKGGLNVIEVDKSRIRRLLMVLLGLLLPPWELVWWVPHHPDTRMIWVTHLYPKIFPMAPYLLIYAIAAAA